MEAFNRFNSNSGGSESGITPDTLGVWLEMETGSFRGHAEIIEQALPGGPINHIKSGDRA